MDPRKEERYGIYNQAKEKLFRCLQLCGRKRRKTATEVGDLAYPQRGLEVQVKSKISSTRETFLLPSNQTITEFLLYDFVSLYGEKKWGVSMYDSQTMPDYELYQSDHR